MTFARTKRSTDSHRKQEGKQSNANASHLQRGNCNAFQMLVRRQHLEMVVRVCRMVTTTRTYFWWNLEWKVALTCRSNHGIFTCHISLLVKQSFSIAPAEPRIDDDVVGYCSWANFHRENHCSLTKILWGASSRWFKLLNNNNSHRKRIFFSNFKWISEYVPRISVLSKILFVVLASINACRQTDSEQIDCLAQKHDWHETWRIRYGMAEVFKNICK